MSKKSGGKDKDKEKSGKKNTSLRLEADTLKALKILAIQKDTSVQQIVGDLIAEYLRIHGVEKKVDES